MKVGRPREKGTTAVQVVNSLLLHRATTLTAIAFIPLESSPEAAVEDRVGVETLSLMNISPEKPMICIRGLDLL